jgi:hypothetical protein
MDRVEFDWSDPIIQKGIEELLAQMKGGESNPTITNDSISDNERALAHYIARAIMRIAPMVHDEIEYMRLIQEGDCQ